MTFDRTEIQRITISALGAVALASASMFAAAAPVTAPAHTAPVGLAVR